MMDPHAISIVVNPKASTTSLVGRFPYTLKSVPSRHVTRLPHPEYPLPAAGSSAQAIIYALGHPSHGLKPGGELTPRVIRQLRDATYMQRQAGGRIHLFGLLDTESPFGSRSTVEQVVRHLKPSGVPLVLHLGVWHPTPHEFFRGLNELRSLQDKTLTLGSLFPIQWFVAPTTSQTLDPFLHPEAQTHQSFVRLPIEHPIMLDDFLMDENDSYVVTNHDLHGLDVLADAIAAAMGQELTTLDSHHHIEPQLQKALDKNRHIVVITNRPSYEKAYTGGALQHPYYERLYNESPEHIVEMLISPHYGYARKPYHTVALIDSPRKGSFDWLLSSLLRQNSHSPYSCCLLDPTSLEGSLLLTNVPIKDDQSYYSQLHDPCQTFASITG